MTAFLDTNVIVYAFDRSDKAKRARAIEVLSSESDYVISAQVLSEFYIVATRKLDPPLRQSEASRVVELLRVLPVVGIDEGLVAAAIATSREADISLWDAQIIEAAAGAGCDVVLTEDLNTGQTIRGITIENPFT